MELVRLAVRAAKQVWRDGYRFTKCGVILPDLVAKDDRQRSLFGNSEAEEQRRVRLMNALDAVNGKFGRGTLFLGGSGSRGAWKARTDMKSPCYTTRLKALPQARH